MTQLTKHSALVSGSVVLGDVVIPCDCLYRCCCAGIINDEGMLLLNTAVILRSLRASLLHDDLPAMFVAIDKARDAQLAAVVQTELTALLSELDERAIVSEISIALGLGSVKLPSDCPDGNYVAGVSVDELDGALDFADQMKPKSRLSREFIATAIALRALRQCKNACFLTHCTDRIKCTHCLSEFDDLS